jgi:hypothetical protein
MRQALSPYGEECIARQKHTCGYPGRFLFLFIVVRAQSRSRVWRYVHYRWLMAEDDVSQFVREVAVNS